MNAWKIILATLVIFGAGVMTGGLLVGYSDRALHDLAHPAQAVPVQHVASSPMPNTNVVASRENRLPVPPPNALFRKDFMDRLNRELDLTAEQHEHIDKIVTDGQDRTRELWRVEWIETRQKIRKELAPKQQARFEELFRSRPHEKLRQNSPSVNAAVPSVTTNTPSSNL